jgi:hypothetical protein
MIKVIRAYDMVTNEHTFSIVAGDKGFNYVFADPKTAMFDSKKRAKMLMDRAGGEKNKLTVEDYLALSTSGLGQFYFSSPIEELSEKIAMKSEKLHLEREMEQRNGLDRNRSLAVASDDIDQVFQDYPELYAQLESEDPDQEITASGMTELVFAALGGVDPNGPNAWLLDYMDGQEAEGFVGDLVFDDVTAMPVTAAVEAPCPPATQDIAINLENRQKAIDTAGYGPLNPAEPNEEFWQDKADRWKIEPEAAKGSTCGNCVMFIQTTKMKQCIADGLTPGDENEQNSWDAIDAGDLGYCEAFDFKCAAARTCNAWVAGGPVTDETGNK